jgi:hypothetical protein
LFLMTCVSRPIRYLRYVESDSFPPSPHLTGYTRLSPQLCSLCLTSKMWPSTSVRKNNQVGWIRYRACSECEYQHSTFLTITVLYKYWIWNGNRYNVTDKRTEISGRYLSSGLNVYKIPCTRSNWLWTDIVILIKDF